MQSLLGSYNSENYKKMIHLEELIDNERMVRKQLEQEAKLIVTQIQMRTKRVDHEKNRSASMHKYYEDPEFKEKAFIRNTLTSTFL